MNIKKSILVLILIALGFIIFLNTHKSQKNNSGYDQLENEIIDDKFVARVLDNDLSYKNLIDVYSPTKITEESIEDEYLKETNSKRLIFETSTNDIIHFLKNDHTLLQLDMIFVSDKITLDKDIKIGVDKSLFERKFSKKIPDQFSISSLEGYVKFIFFFDKNKLTKILYRVEYID